MKKLTILTILFFSIAIYQPTHAQVRVGVNINIGNQPTWGPVGYDYVDYYYLPDIDAYYSVPRHQFIYPEGNQWIFASTLPPRYRGYDLYNGYKVVINEPTPYLHADIYRQRYGNYRGGRGPRQVIIRDSHDERYKNNGRWNRDHDDEGNGKNRGRGKEHDRHEKDDNRDN